VYGGGGSNVDTGEGRDVGSKYEVTYSGTLAISGLPWRVEGLAVLDKDHKDQITS